MMMSYGAPLKMTVDSDDNDGGSDVGREVETCVRFRGSDTGYQW